MIFHTSRAKCQNLFSTVFKKYNKTTENKKFPLKKTFYAKINSLMTKKKKKKITYLFFLQVLTWPIGLRISGGFIHLIKHHTRKVKSKALSQVHFIKGTHFPPKKRFDPTHNMDFWCSTLIMVNVTQVKRLLHKV